MRRAFAGAKTLPVFQEHSVMIEIRHCVMLSRCLRRSFRNNEGRHCIAGSFPVASSRRQGMIALAFAVVIDPRARHAARERFTRSRVPVIDFPASGVESCHGGRFGFLNYSDAHCAPACCDYDNYGWTGIPPPPANGTPPGLFAAGPVRLLASRSLPAINFFYHSAYAEGVCSWISGSFVSCYFALLS